MAQVKRRKIVCDMVMVEGALSKKGNPYNSMYVEVPIAGTNLRLYPQQFTDDFRFSIFKKEFDSYSIGKVLNSFDQESLKTVFTENM